MLLRLGVDRVQFLGMLKPSEKSQRISIDFYSADYADSRFLVFWKMLFKLGDLREGAVV